MAGDESLVARPMERVITPLTAMGAKIKSQNGRPPLRIRGAKLKAFDYRMPVASAQVKTCLLFAGLLADGETRVEEPLRTRDHGETGIAGFWRAVGTAGKCGADSRRPAVARHSRREFPAIFPAQLFFSVPLRFFLIRN